MRLKPDSDWDGDETDYPTETEKKKLDWEDTRDMGQDRDKTSAEMREIRFRQT